MTGESNAQGINLTGLRFEKILTNVERDLMSALERARLESDHSLTIGEQAEIAVRTTLRSYVPSGYGSGHGFVYDAYGDGSKQTDVVITNPDHPLSFPDDKAGTYVVDGVSAAGEVKAVLTADTLDDCIRKGNAFKQLRMTIGEHDHVMTAKQSVYWKELGLVPPYFVVAFESKIAEQTMVERIREAGVIPPPEGKSLGEQDAANTPQPPLDAICILGKGVCWYLRPGNPMGLGINDVPEARALAFIETAAPLSWTLAWLHATMPRIMRGGSVFSPYLLPTPRHVKYMAERGYITPTPAESGAAGINRPKAAPSPDPSDPPQTSQPSDRAED